MIRAAERDGGRERERRKKRFLQIRKVAGAAFEAVTSKVRGSLHRAAKHATRTWDEPVGSCSCDHTV